ncbi:hypothetical protein LFM09_16070 [Lentzea alba]|uniref:hypothetical protein n=1 Tax=Lentzea alba TaxID=2714351 RepID=UPI0039BF7178
MSRLIIAAFALLLAGCTAVAPERPRITESSTEAEPDDRELQEKWWTWAVSSPRDRNPVVDETGEFCGEDQPSDVWFFAGTFGGHAERTCQVPAGRPLAGPAVNSMSNCGSLMRSAKGSVTLDGQQVALRRMEPAPITVKAVKDNPMGLREGRREGQACGLWAWIEPLSPGEHELRIEGEFGDFKTSARYRLTVAAGD